jgi:glycosyltransferase involved in cell wall biosynthesis
MARRLVRRSEVSQAGLRRFLREMDRHPRVELPLEAPHTLAVVVPCFSHAAYLPDLLESIAAQTRQPDEVIFVDDASPDATNEIVREFVAAHQESDDCRFVVLVNDRNMGQAASLNRGISAASSELIMIAVESMLALFEQNRHVALIGAHSIHIVGHEMLAAAPKRSAAYGPPGLPLIVHRPEEVRGYRKYNDLNMTHSGSCFLKTAWEAVGGYRVAKEQRVVPFSDRDFQLRINAIWPVAVAYETPFSFWRRDASVDGGLNS